MSPSVRIIIAIPVALCAFSQQTSSAPNEVIVKFSPGANFSTVTAALSITQTKPVGRGGALLMRSPRLNTSELLAALRARPDVVYAEPNHKVSAFANPNDPGYPYQWALPRIKAPQAWDVSKGSTAIALGVIDSGIDYNHLDLVANVWSAPSTFRVDIGGNSIWCPAGTHGFNAITNSCDPMDDNGHGTIVSGVIGATGNNAMGIAGTSWTTRIIGAKCLDASGNGSVGDCLNAIDFLLQVKERFGAAADIRVLNNSWGCDLQACFSQALLDEIRLASSRGVLFVAAAGHTGKDNDQYPTYPANYSSLNVVSVAATNQNDSLDQPGFSSNYGATTVHLAAPGVDIVSTYPQNRYFAFTGTSLAAPFVSGSAALILSACPNLLLHELKAAIMQNAEALPSLAGKTRNGLLDVNKAILWCTQTPAQITVSDRTFTSGTAAYLALNSITSSGVTISGAAEVSFSAGATIRLLPEFRATAGSAPVTFRARIQ